LDEEISESNLDYRNNIPLFKRRSKFYFDYCCDDVTPVLQKTGAFFSPIPMKSLPVVLSLLLIGSTSLIASDTYLRRFVGEWVGEYKVIDLGSGEEQVARMEQLNYWLDGKLHQMTALQPVGQPTVYETSTVTIDGNLLTSQVSSATKSKSFYGWIRKGTVWWNNPATDQSTQVIVYTERLQPGPAGFTLAIAGYQWRSSTGGGFPQSITATLRRLRRTEKLELIDSDK
jgi:hypothetical protein